MPGPGRRILWLARDALLGAAYYSGAGALYRALWGRKNAVISYHNVLPRERIDDAHVYRVDTPIDVFEGQIRYLSDRWNVLPASRIARPDAEGIFLSFDDAMLNARAIVLPILARFNLTAMFAVCPGVIEGEVPHIWRDHFFLILRQFDGRGLLLPMDGYRSPLAVSRRQVDSLAGRLWQWVMSQSADPCATVREICRANDLPYERMGYQPQRFHPITWEDVRQMRSQGHVIASHTWSHPILRILSAQRKEQELRRSKAVLEDRLGEAVDYLVYPYGGPDEVSGGCMALAAECGYKVGFMNVPDPPPGPRYMNVPRFGLPATASRARLAGRLGGLEHALKGQKGPRRILPFSAQGRQ